MARCKLRPEHITRARELAALGLPLASIAEACGIHRSTLHEWRAQNPDFSDAIHEGHRQGEQALVDRMHAAAHQGDTKAAQWLLTHCPAWRDHWSDAAATRAAVQKVLGAVVDVLMHCPELSPDQRERLLLEFQARGLGRLETETAGGSDRAG